jgi:DNA-binding CsgD family transcriptional regulator
MTRRPVGCSGRCSTTRLAATGKTNRRSARSSSCRPRTVGVHLYNAFPKLGVTARPQLPDLVEHFDR